MFCFWQIKMTDLTTGKESEKQNTFHLVEFYKAIEVPIKHTRKVTHEKSSNLVADKGTKS